MVLHSDLDEAFSFRALNTFLLLVLLDEFANSWARRMVPAGRPFHVLAEGHEVDKASAGGELLAQSLSI